MHSARYAGDHAPQDVTLDKLLNEMKDIEDSKRTAKFVCVLTAILPSGEKIVSNGITERKNCKRKRNYGKINLWTSFYSKRL